MPYETIIYEKENAVGVITLNRDNRLNAVNFKMFGELEQVFDEIANDKSVRVVLITGAGRAFSVGADLKEVGPEVFAVAGRWLARGKPIPMFARIENLDRPVIGAINGLAIGGGCELALVCDLRIASTAAKFGFGEIKGGSIPGGGGSVRAARIMGVAKAKEVLFFGDLIDAEEAHRIGLVNKVVPPEKLLDEAKQWAQTLSKRPPLALQAAKACVNTGMEMSLPLALDFEAALSAFLMKTEDCIEGQVAFREKREPQYKGK